jgi:hypothetical protein
MGHEYTSPQYSAQRFKEFLGSKEMFKKYGFACLNAKCGEDFVSFSYSRREFAVRFEPIGKDDKLQTSLEIRVGDDWRGIKGRVFKVLRSKKGGISNKTYVRLFGDFVKKEIASYLS